MLRQSTGAARSGRRGRQPEAAEARAAWPRSWPAVATPPAAARGARHRHGARPEHPGRDPGRPATSVENERGPSDREGQGQCRSARRLRPGHHEQPERGQRRRPPGPTTAPGQNRRANAKRARTKQPLGGERREEEARGAEQCRPGARRRRRESASPAVAEAKAEDRIEGQIGRGQAIAPHQQERGRRREAGIEAGRRRPPEEGSQAAEGGGHDHECRPGGPTRLQGLQETQAGEERRERESHDQEPVASRPSRGSQSQETSQNDSDRKGTKGQGARTTSEAGPAAGARRGPGARPRARQVALSSPSF